MEVYKTGQFTSETFDAMEVQSENILEEVYILRFLSLVRDEFIASNLSWHAFSFCQKFNKISTGNRSLYYFITLSLDSDSYSHSQLASRWCSLNGFR